MSEAKLCETCEDLLGWIYPDEEPETILEKYDELMEVHQFLRRKKRK